MAVDILRHIGIALLLILFQVFLIDEINFGFLIKPMPYVFLFLLLPFTYNEYLKLAFAFFTGFIIDILSDTYGMNTAASLLMVFTRRYWDGTIETESLEREGSRYINPETKGVSYYLIYSGVLIAIHHFYFFALQYFKFSAFLKILSTTVLSSIVTLLILIIIRLLFQRRS